MKSEQANPWYKKWWIWVIVVVLLLLVIGAMSEEDDSSAPAADATETEEIELAPEKEWTELSSVSSSADRVSGEVFSFSGGDIRIKYSQVAESAGGNSFIYILPEGSTATENAAGELDIAVQDVNVFGDQDGEKIINKPAGNYYIYFNSSGLESYTVSAEEDVLAEKEQ